MSDEEKQSYHFDLLLFFNTVVPPNTANDRTDKKWQYSETGDERGHALNKSSCWKDTWFRQVILQFDQFLKRTRLRTYYQN